MSRVKPRTRAMNMLLERMTVRMESRLEEPVEIGELGWASIHLGSTRAKKIENPSTNKFLGVGMAVVRLGCIGNPENQGNPH